MLLMLLLLGTGRCLTTDRWRYADSFAAQLRCGMNREEIGRVVSNYPGLELHVPDSDLASWNLIAIKGDTHIAMKLESAGLVRWQISWVDTIMHTTYLPEVDLCTGSAPSSTSPAVR